MTGPGLDHSMSQENVSDKVRNLQVGRVETSAQLPVNYLLCTYIIYLLFVDRTEADSTRYKVWPEAAFAEEK